MGTCVRLLFVVCVFLNRTRLVAVSKTKPAELVRECYDAGQIHFGENYVQEIVDKAPHLPTDIKWHFIGHVQTNKCKKLVQIPNLWMVESVDSTKLSRELNNACKATRPQNPLNVLVQVNTSGEESKSGCDPSECVEITSNILQECPYLKFCGLMTIGRLHSTGDADFLLLSDLKKKLCDTLGLNPVPFELSMGMSADMENAIAHGSTFVRVGSAIFGEREKQKTA
eukprot:c18081_g1_i1.p1 GENE.c18081_g1_i1~~c18081_g1_i1.p1  ORF type:complete len:226 (-),score=43.54 c18081_g1_i1:144-821(-)